MTRGSLNFGNASVQVLITTHADGTSIGTAVLELKDRSSSHGIGQIEPYHRVRAPSAKEAWAALALWIGESLATAAALALLLVFSSCGAPFVPAYPGEPECGSPKAIHATIGAACDAQAVQVACDCTDRETLECVGGAWAYSHWLCTGGLGASTPVDGGTP